MDDGLALPWWEYYPSGLAVPGSVVQLDARTDESTVKAFLQAGSRAETAERFISGKAILQCATVCDDHDVAYI